MDIKSNSEQKFNLMIPSSASWLRMLVAVLVYLGHSDIRICAGQGALFSLVMSGYIFTRFFLKEWEETSRINHISFFKKRFWKIIPPLYLIILLSILIKNYAHKSIDYYHVISIVTFTSNYFNAFHGHPNTGFSHLWTVSMVMQFYFIWPFVFMHFIKLPSGRKKLSCLLVGVILSAIIYRSILTFFHLGSVAYIYNAFETRVDALAIGALMALNIDLEYFKNFCTYFRRFQILQLIMTASLIVLMGLAPITFRNTLGFTLHSILFCLLMIQLLQLEKSNYFSIAPSLFNITTIGSISYWFYLLHPWGITFGEHLKMPRSLQIIIGGIIFLCAVIISYFAIKRIGVMLNSILNRSRVYNFIHYQCIMLLKIR